MSLKKYYPQYLLTFSLFKRFLYTFLKHKLKMKLEFKRWYSVSLNEWWFLWYLLYSFMNALMWSSRVFNLDRPTILFIRASFFNSYKGIKYWLVNQGYFLALNKCRLDTIVPSYVSRFQDCPWGDHSGIRCEILKWSSYAWAFFVFLRIVPNLVSVIIEKLFVRGE